MSQRWYTLQTPQRRDQRGDLASCNLRQVIVGWYISSILARWCDGLTVSRSNSLWEKVLGLFRKQLNTLQIVGGCSYLLGVPNGIWNNCVEWEGWEGTHGLKKPLWKPFKVTAVFGRQARSSATGCGILNQVDLGCRYQLSLETPSLPVLSLHILCGSSQDRLLHSPWENAF